MRPAITVENVLAVTIDATYTATPTSRTVRKLSTDASMPLSPMYGSARSIAAM